MFLPIEFFKYNMVSVILPNRTDLTPPFFLIVERAIDTYIGMVFKRWAITEYIASRTEDKFPLCSLFFHLGITSKHPVHCNINTLIVLSL